MARKKKVDEAPAGAPLWMATFGDLMSLLLTFFVLLISFSTIAEHDFNAAMGSLQGALGALRDPHDKISIINRQRSRTLIYIGGKPCAGQCGRRGFSINSPGPKLGNIA